MRKGWLAFGTAFLLALSVGAMAACGAGGTGETGGAGDSQTELPDRGDQGSVPGETDDGAITVGTAEELRAWADRVSEGESFRNATLRLTSDIDLSGELWTPIDCTSRNLTGFTLDGDGHKISGMKAEKSLNSTTGEPQNAPDADDVGFFGRLVNNSITIKDLTFSGASVTGRYSVGVLVGWFQSGSLTLDHVSVTGSTVLGRKWFGGMIGCVEGGLNSETTATAVSVTDTTVCEAYAYDPDNSGTTIAIRCGGFVGYTRNMKYSIRDGNFSGNTLTAYHSVGGIFGTVVIDDVGKISISGTTVSKNIINGHSSASYLHEILNTDNWSYTERDSFKTGNSVAGNTVQTDAQ